MDRNEYILVVEPSGSYHGSASDWWTLFNDRVKQIKSMGLFLTVYKEESFLLKNILITCGKDMAPAIRQMLDINVPWHTTIYKVEHDPQ